LTTLNRDDVNPRHKFPENPDEAISPREVGLTLVHVAPHHLSHPESQVRRLFPDPVLVRLPIVDSEGADAEDGRKIAYRPFYFPNHYADLADCGRLNIVLSSSIPDISLQQL